MAKSCDEAKGSSGSKGIKINSSLSFDLISNAFNKLFACETSGSVYSVYTEISYLLLFYL